MADVGYIVDEDIIFYNWTDMYWRIRWIIGIDRVAIDVYAASMTGNVVCKVVF